MKRRDLLLLGGLVLGILIVGRRQVRAEPVRVTPNPAWPPAAPPRVELGDWGDSVGPAAEAAAVEGVGPSLLDQLLEVNFATDPRPGNFYQVGPDDTPETIARAALSAAGQPYKERQVLDYVYCFTSSPWNLERYGSPSTSKRGRGAGSSNAYPKKWIIPGFGQGLRAAFLPRNADAVAMMGEGLRPPRTVDPKTAKGLTDDVSYGVIWLPPISPEQLALGIVTCAPYSWDDGSSTINPDPVLLELLEAA